MENKNGHCSDRKMTVLVQQRFLKTFVLGRTKIELNTTSESRYIQPLGSNFKLERDRQWTNHIVELLLLTKRIVFI